MNLGVNLKYRSLCKLISKYKEDIEHGIGLILTHPLQLSSDLVTFPPTPAPGGLGGSGLILGTSDKGGDDWVLVTLGPCDTEGGDKLVFTPRPRRARKGLGGTFGGTLGF